MRARLAVLLGLCGLAALLVAASASGRTYDGIQRHHWVIDGTQELVLHGRGQVQATVTATGSDPIAVVAKHAALRVVSQSGGVDVTCKGVGHKKTVTRSGGRTVVVCAGWGGKATISGSSFSFSLQASPVKVDFPVGTKADVRARGRGFALVNPSSTPTTTP